MKHLLFETGGRPLNNDDFVTFQDEIYYAVNGQFLGLPACVVQGCDVTPASTGKHNISAGLVYIEGEIRRFEGVSEVTLPQELYCGPFETTELRAYQTGGSKATMGEAVVLCRPYSATTPGWKVIVQPEGVLRAAKAREALFRAPCEIGMVADFPAEYDTTGKGKYGTNAYGWALCNGQNNTPNMAGRFPVGFDGSNAAPDYNATRKVGGLKEVALTEDQNGPHAHSMDAAGAHTHSFNNWQLNKKADRGDQEWVPDPGIRNNNFNTASAGNHSHVINQSGQGTPHENRPPYMVLAFRMWVGF